MKKTNLKIASFLAGAARNEVTTLEALIYEDEQEAVENNVDMIQSRVKLHIETGNITITNTLPDKIETAKVIEMLTPFITSVHKAGSVKAYAKKSPHGFFNKTKDTHIDFATFQIIDEENNEVFDVSAVLVVAGEILYQSAAHSSLFYIFKKNKFYSLFVD